ncbi:putative monocarboxylate transporter [Atractiella rhizophila]|nr:putative monocarboxylate transporter [Atractiella rhizophila]
MSRASSPTLKVPENEQSSQEEKDLENLSPSRPQPEWIEGGLHGYLTVVGASIVSFVTFGHATGFGVYQDYYKRHQLADYSDSNISWIGSLQLALLFLSSIVTGRMVDSGYFYSLTVTGSILLVFSIFMLSLSNSYYQIFLSQAVGMGLGCGCLFLPTLGAVSGYFRKRRALAMGYVAAGSGLGGVCLPIMLNNLINDESVGFEEGVRDVAYLILGLLVVANLLIRVRRPPAVAGQMTEKVKKTGGLKAVVSDPSTVLVSCGFFFVYWGLFTPSFYIQVFLRAHGVGETFSFYTVAILNGSSIVGRILPNFFADKIGLFNHLIPFTILTAILEFVWLACTNVGSAIAFSIIYGFGFGGIVSLMAPVCVSLAHGPHEIGIRMGFVFTFVGLAALTGTPIAGQILIQSNNRFWGPAVFSGISVFVGGLLFMLARRFQSQTKQTWKV